jgi:hypothetical protein
LRSATDIVSISTGRETILIGPLSAFGAHASAIVMRERYSIRQALNVFITRPNAEELLRPHLRRWGVDAVSLHATTRHTLLEALARAAANGAIGIAKVPDITLSFAGASLDEGFVQASLSGPARGPLLPDGLADRMVLVFEMVPQHMEGETRLAFEQAVTSLGIGVVVGGVISWIGAHFIPGVNLAVLAFDVFALSGAVLHTLEKAGQIVTDVKNAKSPDELNPAAIAMAAVLAALIAEGVLGRLLRAKSITKGVGKQGGYSKGKPSLPKKDGAGRTGTAKRNEVEPENDGKRMADKPKNRPGFELISKTHVPKRLLDTLTPAERSTLEKALKEVEATPFISRPDKSVFYSGKAGDRNAWEIAEEAAKSGKFDSVNSLSGGLLNRPEIREKLPRDAMNFVDQLASAKLAEGAKGAVNLIGDLNTIKENSVFRRVELPRLLDNLNISESSKSKLNEMRNFMDKKYGK